MEQSLQHGSLGGASAVAGQIRKETALERLGSYAATAERVGNMIDGFISRCRGADGPNPTGNLTEVPTGHFAQLDRLEKLLCRAEALASELGSIG